MGSQPIERQAVGNVSLNDVDIFDMPTQQVINDDVYDAPTQLQSSQSDDIYDAATQRQPDTNDIFDAPTQRLNVRNESESPEPELSNGIPSVPRHVRAFESQLSPVLTPEWSMAKLIPKESKKVEEKSISKKEENLKRKQQWIFNMSDDESDKDDDDLDFDLTPNRQDDSFRHSMLGSSTESKSANRKSDPRTQNNPKTVDHEKSAELGKRDPDNKTPISKNDAKPAKRLRSLSIVLSRDEVNEYLKSDNQMSAPSNLVEKPKRKTETTPKETSIPTNDGKSKKKTETAVKGGSGTKKGSMANKTPQAVPVTRNLRTKINNSPVEKDNKNSLKRKNDDIDTEDNKKPPRKRATKATNSMVSESKITKKDTQKKEEKTKDPVKETKKTKPKVDKTPKAAPVLREVRFIYTITKFII